MPHPSLGQRLETRRNNFDFLRFFFASLVIFSHSFILLRPDQVDADPLARVTYMKMSFGTLAVACFFAISGFLITQSWLRTKNSRDFAKKRLLRIYPGWIVALLFGVLVVAPLLRFPHSLDLGALGTYLSFEQLLLCNCGLGQMLPGRDSAHALCTNGSTWTIPFEIMCYMLVFALGLLNMFHKRVRVLLLSVALLIYINLPIQTLDKTFGLRPAHLYVPYFADLAYLPVFMAYFLSGAVFFLFRDRIPHSPRLLAASLVLVPLTLGHLPLSGLFFIILPTFGFYILFYLAFLPLDRLYAFAKHGDLSYGVYLYAWPMQMLLISEQFRGYRLSPLTLFLAAWALACLAAVLSWRLIERPALRLKPRSARPPVERTGVPAVAEGA